jgi:hypothetical protein
VITTPWPDRQAILDTTLAHAPDAAKARFALLVAGQAVPDVARSQNANANECNGYTGTWRNRSPDLESWTDDLDRVVVYLSRQDFGLADRLLNRWLNARTDSPPGMSGSWS